MLRLFATPKTTPVIPERMPSLMPPSKGHPGLYCHAEKDLAIGARAGERGTTCPCRSHFSAFFCCFSQAFFRKIPPRGENNG
jgi:hypothetical protein